MNNKQRLHTAIRWKRFSRAHFAAFRSLHREVQIGVLAVAMLATAGLKAQRQSTVQADAQTDGHRHICQTVQDGDLLFCIEHAEQGLSAAIASVTQGADGARVVHVAIACHHNQQPMALETTPSRGVTLTPLNQFLTEAEHDDSGMPLVMVARLRDTLGVAASVCRAHAYLGLPYDTLYMPDTREIYCSELVQLSYQRPDGTHIFPTIPMSFSDATGRIAPYWQQLYSSRGLEVPEGLAGTNPGQLSRDSAIYLLDLR